MTHMVRLTRGVSTLASVLLLITALFIVGFSAADNSGPVIVKGEGDQCVADTDFMRRNHMDLLTHQRDETVIDGIRSEPFSLSECVECHAQKTPGGKSMRVDDEGQFCQSCHAYVAVKIDCFGCHAAIPDQAAVTPDFKERSANTSVIEEHLFAVAQYLKSDRHEH